MISKRLIGIVLLVGVGAAVWHFHHKAEHEQYFLEQRALVTAKLWVASAKFRKDEPKFLAFRDSLLVSSQMTKEEMTTYLSQYQAEPETYNSFTELVGTYVDSLAKMEGEVADSVILPDSLK